MKKVRVEDAAGMELCHDVTAMYDGFKGAAFKRGHIIEEADIPKLLDYGKRTIFVWEENAGEWNNDENATADTGVVWTEPAAEEPAHHTSTGTTRITVSGVTELTTDDANGTVRINMRRRGIVVNFEESRVDESTGSYIECPARSVTLEREIVVGRLGECDLMIDDMAVSGRHLKITREDGVMMVTDLHSSNGTELNGQRISRATNLNSGDMLTIGRTTLKVTFKN